MSTIQPIIATTDLDRLLVFYTKVFGAEEVQRIPDFYIMLRLGDSELGLVADVDSARATPKRILLSIEVDSVDRLLGTVESFGGRLLAPPNDMPWGQRVAHAEDPDGNAVNLTQQI